MSIYPPPPFPYMSRIQFWHSGEISADQSRRVLAQEQYMCSYLHQERFEDTKSVIRSNKSKNDRQYNGENEEDRTTTLHRKLKSEQYKPYKIFLFH